MEQAYWLERQRVSIANARAATLADVRLIHYELADRYSLEAANAAKARPLIKRPKLKRGIGEQLTTAFRK